MARQPRLPASRRSGLAGPTRRDFRRSERDPDALVYLCSDGPFEILAGAQADEARPAFVTPE